MNFKKLGIKTVRPLAILRGGLNGTRFIAEAKKKNSKTELLSLSPPDYNLTNAFPIKPHILESAIEKHGFIQVEHYPITTFEEYEEYLRGINRPPKQK